MNKNLATITLEEQQDLLESRKNLAFFNNGYVDGYIFSFWLFESLWFDGFDVQSPNQILEALFAFVTDEQVQKKIVRETHINNMTSEAYAVYPEGKTVMLHCTYFIHNIHDIINNIGEISLQIPREDKDMLYSWWIKREHIYTYTYFDTFFRDFTKLLNSIPNYKSSLMGLHISRHILDEDFSAYSTIIEKEQRSKEILDRINKAVEQEFYLEAIALEESCISDRLSLILYIKGQKAGTKNFARLIEHCSEFIPKELKSDIDSWRRERNNSIHNLVRSSPLEKLIELDKLDELSAITANLGVELLAKVNEWFEVFILYEMNPFHFRIQDNYKSLNS